MSIYHPKIILRNLSLYHRIKKKTVDALEVVVIGLSHHNAGKFWTSNTYSIFPYQAFHDVHHSILRFLSYAYALLVELICFQDAGTVLRVDSFTYTL